MRCTERVGFFWSAGKRSSPVAANEAVVSDGNALCSPTFGWVRQCGEL